MCDYISETRNVVSIKSVKCAITGANLLDSVGLRYRLIPLCHQNNVLQRISRDNIAIMSSRLAPIVTPSTDSVDATALFSSLRPYNLRNYRATVLRSLHNRASNTHNCNYINSYHVAPVDTRVFKTRPDKVPTDCRLIKASVSSRRPSCFMTSEAKKVMPKMRLQNTLKRKDRFTKQHLKSIHHICEILRALSFRLKNR